MLKFHVLTVTVLAADNTALCIRNRHYCHIFIAYHNTRNILSQNRVFVNPFFRFFDSGHKNAKKTGIFKTVQLK